MNQVLEEERIFDRVATSHRAGQLPRVAELPPGADLLRLGHLLDGRFLIGEPLSHGGMSTIYLAKDTDQGHRTVVIKVPYIKYEADPAYYGRFLREEELGQKLDHPGLLKFISVSGRKSRPYLVTEYLAGWTLEQLLQTVRPLPAADAFRVASQVCEAVGHMHQRGFIHRDLKPGNIMICADQTIRIMDFGLSAPLAAHRGLFNTLAPVFGTPQYMSPEQVKNRNNDERTDVYSLGVVLYEMLTGELPFKHEEAWVSAQLRVTGDPVAPRQLNPKISPPAEEIILRAMRRDPAERYPGMAAFQADLLAPESVRVTGLCERLQAPRWSLSYEQTQLLRGLAMGFGVILFLLLLFPVLVHMFNAKKAVKSPAALTTTPAAPSAQSGTPASPAPSPAH